MQHTEQIHFSALGATPVVLPSGTLAYIGATCELGHFEGWLPGWLAFIPNGSKGKNWVALKMVGLQYGIAHVAQGYELSDLLAQVWVRNVRPANGHDPEPTEATIATTDGITTVRPRPSCPWCTSAHDPSISCRNLPTTRTQFVDAFISNHVRLLSQLGAVLAALKEVL